MKFGLNYDLRLSGESSVAIFLRLGVRGDHNPKSGKDPPDLTGLQGNNLELLSDPIQGFFTSCNDPFGLGQLYRFQELTNLRSGL